MTANLVKLQVEQETDEVYADIDLRPESDVRNIISFVLSIVQFQLVRMVVKKKEQRT